MAEKRKRSDSATVDITQDILRQAASLQARQIPDFPAPFLDRMVELGLLSQKDLLNLTSVSKKNLAARDHVLQAHIVFNLNRLDEKNAELLTKLYRPFHVELTVYNAKDIESAKAQYATEIIVRGSGQSYADDDFQVGSTLALEGTIKWPLRFKKLVFTDGTFDLTKLKNWPQNLNTLILTDASFNSLPQNIKQLQIDVPTLPVPQSLNLPESVEFLSLSVSNQSGGGKYLNSIRWPPNLHTLVLTLANTTVENFSVPKTVQTLEIYGNRLRGMRSAVWHDNLKNLKIEMREENNADGEPIETLRNLPDSVVTIWWQMHPLHPYESIDTRKTDFSSMLNHLPHLSTLIFDSYQRFDLNFTPNFQILVPKEHRIASIPISTNVAEQKFTAISKDRLADFFPATKLDKRFPVYRG